MSVPVGYKATEAGVIPEVWDVCSVRDILHLRRGRVISHGEIARNPGPYPVYSSQTKNDGVMGYLSSFDFEGEYLSWTTDGANAGTVFFRKGKFNCTNVCGTARSISPKDTFVRYFAYYLNTVAKDYVSYVGNPKLMSGVFGDIPIIVPTPAEQAAIAEALSDMDEAIAAQEAVISKKRALKAATMQALLSGTRRLPGFSGEWERRSFDHLFQFLRNGSASRAALSANGAIGYIHYGDIHSNPRPHMDCSKGALPRIAREVVSRLPRVQDGDLLIADASEDYDGTGKSVEATNIGDDEVVAGLHTLLLRPVEKMAPGFAGYLQFILEVKRQYVAAAQGVSVYGLSRSAVKSVEVAIPNYDEQAAISSCLMDMEIDLSHQQDSLKKLCDLKAGMMQQLLTGKIRLV